ncbi:NAD(P)/FAD-dependent oxidoreductase [Pseudoalteromonas aurantia]|uniref:FAD-binding monooxygenase n=1 Tax=Pseudoalteromonas aurantia TaxID=43654 RepID=A0ABY2W2Y4_9GAMM|nr:tryptophan 7-halogenase [Pseudoalteromonas aurantia]TMO79052.1 FAD-binding monooxygenase [Pseudoalteromonas aurantia]
MTESQLPKTQVVIIGSGIGGCIAALALAPYYSVTLIDKDAEPQNKVGESLAPAAIRILKQLNLQHLLSDPRHIVSQGTLSYWGSDEPTLIDNLKNPDGFGWHLDRAYFEKQLREACYTANIHTIWPAQLVDSTKTSHGWKVTYQHNAHAYQLISDIVIDASGRHCVFARQQGIARHQFDKLMSIGFTANLNITKNVAVISHTDDSWWYSAPLHQNDLNAGIYQQKRIFSWYAEPHIIKAAQIHTPQVLLQRAQHVTGLGALISQLDHSSATLHPMLAANSSKLESCSGNAWFAIGDSAISFDPLSSQGMFNAMASAMQLSELLINNGLTHTDNRHIYQQQVDKIWQSYLAHRALYYKMVS